MIIQTLNSLWKKKKRSLGKRLQKGISDLANVLNPVAAENNYSQRVVDNEIQWHNPDGGVGLLFFYISDPRNLEAVSKVFRRTKDTKCDLACIFVHQWTGGEGNWDVFGLHSKRGLVHWNRFWGNRWLMNDTGPFLREDIYRLFKCGQDFPLFSRKKWAKMLEESVEDTIHQLSILAETHTCHQKQNNDMIQWKNTNGKIEAMFFVAQDFPAIDDYIKIYDRIKINKCPVTFVIQKAQPGIFDIFRFSARSYIEHHNQAK